MLISEQFHLVKRCAVVCAVLLASFGCSSTTERNSSIAREGRDVFGRSTQMEGATWNDANADAIRVPTALGPNAWTIVLTAIEGDQQDRANHLLEQVQSVGRLPDAFLMERNGRQIIAVGSYQSPTEQVATIELERVRSIEVEGAYPFARAFLAPPSGDLSRGTIPEYDLRNAKAQYGNDVRYTLQIAVFAREDTEKPSSEEQALFRRSAEDATRALRQGGELAFYYHGPNRSMVTIGVFTEEDHEIDGGIAIESARLQAARNRHPKNLLNGRTIIEKVRSSNGGFVERDQRSSLVSIPG